MKRGQRHRRGPSEQRARARGAHDGRRRPRAEPRATRAARERSIRQLDAQIRREKIGLIVEVPFILRLGPSPPDFSHVHGVDRKALRLAHS